MANKKGRTDITAKTVIIPVVVFLVMFFAFPDYSERFLAVSAKKGEYESAIPDGLLWRQSASKDSGLMDESAITLMLPSSSDEKISKNGGDSDYSRFLPKSSIKEFEKDDNAIRNALKFLNGSKQLTRP